MSRGQDELSVYKSKLMESSKLESQCESMNSDLSAQLKTKRQEISNHCSTRNAKEEEEQLVLKGIACEQERVLEQVGQFYCTIFGCPAAL